MSAYGCEHSSPVNHRDWRDVICVSAMAVCRGSSNRQSPAVGSSWFVLYNRASTNRRNSKEFARSRKRDEGRAVRFVRFATTLAYSVNDVPSRLLRPIIGARSERLEGHAARWSCTSVPLLVLLVAAQ